MTLLKAEEGFRMLKGTLGLRPNYHQKEQRVDGHVFITKSLILEGSRELSAKLGLRENRPLKIKYHPTFVPEVFF